MKKNRMDIAVVCENKKQREHALEVAKSNGIAFGKWNKYDGGNILRVYEYGDWIFWDFHGDAETTLTYDEFIAKYGNTKQPQPDPIAEIFKRLEAVEQRVFGNTEQPQAEADPQPGAIYEGVFSFNDRVCYCMNGEQMLYYSYPYRNYCIGGNRYFKPQPHRLVPVDEFTVGKFYACSGINPNEPFAYSMYLGNDKFVGWYPMDDQPIFIHGQSEMNVQLLEAVKA